jgi:hypothetical protein
MNKEQRYIKGEWFSHFPLGQETPGQHNWRDSAEEKLGGDACEVSYYINEWRYRGHIKPGNNVNACFGCSNTFGYGVQTAYPQLVKFTNCGINGISNDAIARMAYAYCEQFNPKVITVLWTFNNRREWVDDKGVIHKFKSQENQQLFELQNEAADDYNFYKNKIFLQSYCKSKDIKMLDYNFHSNDKGARDGMHPGPDWHVNMAANILGDLRD